MTPRSDRKNTPVSRLLGASTVALVVVAALLGGCGDKKKDKASSQTAAKVNKEEITVLQINQALAQQPAPPPAQAASASGLVLEKLIDQELALQKAGEQKLDRHGRVIQQIEAAKREIISRAYFEKIGEGAPKPTPAEVTAYFAAHPALFANRRIFNLQELDIEATPAQLEAAKTALAAAKTFSAFVDYLKTNEVKFRGSEGVRAAEQLPMASVDQFAALKDGQAIFVATPGGARVIHLVSSRSQPVSAQAAVPAIEQFLLNERKRKLIADDLHALRSAAKIEYVGNFASNRPPELPAPRNDAPPLTSIAPALSGSAAVAAPQIEIAPREPAAASMPSDATLDKGLKGMK